MRNSSSNYEKMRGVVFVLLWCKQKHLAEHRQLSLNHRCYEHMFVNNEHGTHSSPTERRCCPIRRTISWSVWPMRRPGGRSPFLAASPLRWAPLVHGWCMVGSGSSLRVRLRGGRWPSSPESLEARLARSAARARRAPPVTIPAASASSRRDVTPAARRPRSMNHLPLFAAKRFSIVLPTPSRYPFYRYDLCERDLSVDYFGKRYELWWYSRRTQKSAENDATAVYLRCVQLQHRPSFFLFRVTFVCRSVAHRM